MFLKRQCTVFSILFAFAEKGEACSGELEAAGQRAAHPGAAEASLRGSGQSGPWRTLQVWWGWVGNQGPILLKDQVSSVPVLQTCISQALRPVHIEKGVLESGLGCSATPTLSAREGARYGLDLVLSPLGGDRCLHLLALCCLWGCDHPQAHRCSFRSLSQPLRAPMGAQRPPGHSHVEWSETHRHALGVAATPCTAVPALPSPSSQQWAPSAGAVHSCTCSVQKRGRRRSYLLDCS